MQAKVRTVAFQGIDVLPIDVQVMIAPGNIAFAMVGLADKAVGESRERIRAALRALGLALPPQRITVNLSPADLAKEEAQFTQIQTGVQVVQQQRQITQALGSETAGYASSGIAMSGTALDVLQSSAEQGALAKQMTQFKGEQQVYAYDEQAKSYEQMAEAAQNASTGSFIGAGIQAVASIAAFL